LSKLFSILSLFILSFSNHVLTSLVNFDVNILKSKFAQIGHPLVYLVVSMRCFAAASTSLLLLLVQNVLIDLLMLFFSNYFFDFISIITMNTISIQSTKGAAKYAITLVYKMKTSLCNAIHTRRFGRIWSIIAFFNLLNISL
jgi:hypothetical protein